MSRLTDTTWQSQGRLGCRHRLAQRVRIPSDSWTAPSRPRSYKHHVPTATPKGMWSPLGLQLETGDAYFPEAPTIVSWCLIGPNWMMSVINQSPYPEKQESWLAEAHCWKCKWSKPTQITALRLGERHCLKGKFGCFWRKRLRWRVAGNRCGKSTNKCPPEFISGENVRSNCWNICQGDRGRVG